MLNKETARSKSIVDPSLRYSGSCIILIIKGSPDSALREGSF